MMSQNYQALIQSHALYLDLFENAPLGYILIDQKGIILQANHKASHLLGEEKFKLKTKPLYRFIHEASKFHFMNHLKQCLKSSIGSTLECEVVLLSGKGQIEKKVQLTSIRTEPNVIRMTLKKLGSHTPSLTTLSHDLRAPLTSAKLCSQMLQAAMKEEFATPKNRKLFQIQVDELDRADRMIKDLLDEDKLKNGPHLFRKCCLNKIAIKCLESISLVHKEKALFNYISKGEVRGFWSKDCLHRILENLVNNAIKYGDKVRPISVTIEDHGKHVSLSVHNFGCPIEKRNQKKIFEAFHRTADAIDGPEQGWGLGLKLVNEFVQKHGGEIKLESTIAKGTTFEVLLPKIPISS